MIDITDITCLIESPKEFSLFYKQQKYSAFCNLWHEKKSQGRVARDATDLDMQISNCYLNNHNVHDNVRSFVLKGRLQLLPCYSLLHTYYPLSYDKRCMICNHPSETVSHSLSGCRKYKSIYEARQNRIVDLINNNRLGGVMVKASASRAEDRGSTPGWVIPKTLKMEF